jgi:hypothetical protein
MKLYLLLTNQILYIQPTLEQTRSYWLMEFHSYVGEICTLPRLMIQRLKVFGESFYTR